jgi:hypothetical protein
MRNIASTVKIMGSVYNGTSWTPTLLSSNDFANVSPRVALQSNGKASVLWSSGDLTSHDSAQYITGELLLSRYDGSSWTWTVPIY